jgi:hypothetical protein
MKYLFILLMLVGCTTQRQYISLPLFPETHTDYRYFIRIPYDTQSVVIYWYYGYEDRNRMLYSSGYVQTRTQTIETDMYFPTPGPYVLIYYCQTESGVKKYKQTYNVRLNQIYE